MHDSMYTPFSLLLLAQLVLCLKDCNLVLERVASFITSAIEPRSGWRREPDAELINKNKERDFPIQKPMFGQALARHKWQQASFKDSKLTHQLVLLQMLPLQSEVLITKLTPNMRTTQIAFLKDYLMLSTAPNYFGRMFDEPAGPAVRKSGRACNESGRFILFVTRLLSLLHCRSPVGSYTFPPLSPGVGWSPNTAPEALLEEVYRTENECIMDKQHTSKDYGHAKMKKCFVTFIAYYKITSLDEAENPISTGNHIPTTARSQGVL
ncbi:hypothetical protein FIBSPDRAFT_900289 [Athelia psychrophila]|uniref:Uncharacterized protein n=1 Tax=Athelia psychrophila TaxID=1759441 RepID=A0A165YLA9_9AGAM|nr:hypothetical protein FIBSPDRAFT_900289 [Fibularhizoctonia sp. CBS 109695]